MAIFVAQLRRSAVFMAVLCIAIALFLTVLEGRGLWPHLVYAFAIGLCCWTLTNGLRLLTHASVQRWRVSRGLAPLGGHIVGWKGTVPMLMVGMLLGPSLGLSIGDALTGERSPSLWQWDSPATRITLALTVLASLVSLFVLTLFEHLASARAGAEAAQRLAAENQLKLLESQLEPHMLFNTLANLRVLIAIDATRAQSMLDHLISFLRSTLGASRNGTHALATEFERVADYLALMALRMGPRLQYSLDLPDDLRQAAMPALLLQPLVENAIRHGLEPQVAGGRIELRARREGREGKTLVLTVRDTGAGLAGTTARDGTHYGLDHVRSRLSTLFGANASFTLQAALDGEGGSMARVTLPLSALQA